MVDKIATFDHATVTTADETYENVNAAIYDSWVRINAESGSVHVPRERVETVETEE